MGDRKVFLGATATEHTYAKNMIEDNGDVIIESEIQFSEFSDETSDIIFLEKQGDELLIDLVRNYPCLYEKSNKDFKDKNMKESSWMEISQILKIPPVECQNRWLRLRQYFVKERLILEKLQHSGAGQVKHKTWPLYKSMSFLESHVPKRKTFSNCLTNQYLPVTPETENLLRTETSSSSSCTGYDDTLGDESTSQTATTEPATPKVKKIAEGSKRLEETPQSCYSGQPRFKKQKKIDPIGSVFSKMNSTVENMMQKIQNEEEDSREDVFGKLVAKELKKLEEKEQKIKKKEILNILYQ